MSLAHWALVVGVDSNGGASGFSTDVTGGGRTEVGVCVSLLSQMLVWCFLLQIWQWFWDCLLYTSPSPRDATLSRMPSSA